jgi:hypothetical protein
MNNVSVEPSWVIPEDPLFAMHVLMSQTTHIHPARLWDVLKHATGWSRVRKTIWKAVPRAAIWRRVSYK